MASSSFRRSTGQSIHSHNASPSSTFTFHSASSSSLFGSASRDRAISSIQSISTVNMKNSTFLSNHHQKRRCLCSPTTHPGSFRCSLHKSLGSAQHQRFPEPKSSNNLYARRSAMRNSLVRIGVVQGDFVKHALAIRPSSHQQRRRSGFQKKPSRLSISACDD